MVRGRGIERRLEQGKLDLRRRQAGVKGRCRKGGIRLMLDRSDFTQVHVPQSMIPLSGCTRQVLLRP